MNRTRRTVVLHGIAVATLLLICRNASAQTSSLFGSQSRSSRSNSGFGANRQQSGRGSGGFGQSQLGRLFGGTGGQIGGQTGSLGQSEFVGRASGQQEDFVGRRGANNSGPRGNSSRSSRRSGGSNRTRRRDNNNEAKRGGDADAKKLRFTIRTIDRATFSYPKRTSASVGATVDASFRRLARRHTGLREVTVVVGADNQAVLRGTVGSDEDRKLAAVVARLEPGVRSVRNEIRVATPAGP